MLLAVRAIAAPDPVGADFTRATALRRDDHLDEANAIFLEIVRLHPEHETAEFAANLALDTLVRQGRDDELGALVDEMLANKKLVLRRVDLRDQLLKIHAQHARKQAEELERSAHESGDLAAYDRCGEAYLALAVPKDSYGDESLYNAIVCFQEGKSFERARAAARRLLSEYKKSRVVPRVIARLGKYEGDMANFETAAGFLEHYAAIAPAEKDVPDALSDAFLYRVSLGQLDRADADLRLAEIPRGRFSHPNFAWASIMMIEARLAAGQRSAAIARALALTGDRSTTLARGKLFAELACPVPLVAELCPMARDPKLVRRAQAELRPLTDGDDPTDLGRRIALDLELDANRPDRGALAERYRELTGPDDPPETRIVAHARLALLAKRDHRIDEEANELSLCITEARDQMVGATWLQHCERERATLPRPPVVAPLLEQIGEPAIPGFEPAVEAEPVRPHGR